jgi:hypothetical protein
MYRVFSTYLSRPSIDAPLPPSSLGRPSPHYRLRMGGYNWLLVEGVTYTTVE